MSSTPHAVVLTAPDGGTEYLRWAVERSLADMAPLAVLEVVCPDADTRSDLAAWCLGAGHRIVDPFAHWSTQSLLVQNVPPVPAAA